VNTQQERLLRSFLAARDPGDAPARLRGAATRVPYETRLPVVPAFDVAITRLFGPARWVRPLLALVVIAAIVAAAVGAARIQPWRPFPPRGLIAFTVPLGPTGTSGIRLVAADGSGERTVTPLTPNIFDHSPRWSADGRTLLFARTSNLDPLGACGGVGSVVLYDVATTTERILATGLRPIDEVAWSPSGAHVAFLWPPPGCNAPGEFGVLDVTTGQVTSTPLGDGAWKLAWTGESAVAVSSEGDVTEDPQAEATLVQTTAHDDASVATWSIPWKGGAGGLKILDRSTGRTTELGLGASPAWSPDDSAIAFLQAGVPGGPTAVELLRYPLVIVRLGEPAMRVMADVFWLEDQPPGPVFGGSPPANLRPLLFWTADGEAIYWMDARGGHVVDVVTGRNVDLPAVLDGCPDLRWQPSPPP
jgi:hypothetical protein